MTNQSLPNLLTEHSDSRAIDCIGTPRAAGEIVRWNHADGYVVATTVSALLLVGMSDPLALISITDITELLWCNHSPTDPG